MYTNQKKNIFFVENPQNWNYILMILKVITKRIKKIFSKNLKFFSKMLNFKKQM